jgi:hypothetical protein
MVSFDPAVVTYSELCGVFFDRLGADALRYHQVWQQILVVLNKCPLIRLGTIEGLSTGTVSTPRQPSN